MQGRAVTKRQREIFLAALADLPFVSMAAARAGLSRQTVYRMRKQDEAFAAAWDEAIEEAVDAIEAEAYRRALHGYDVYLTCAKGLILDADGKPVMQRRYSDLLLIMFLRAYRPELYRERRTVDVRLGDLAQRMDEGRQRVQQLALAA